MDYITLRMKHLAYFLLIFTLMSCNLKSADKGDNLSALSDSVELNDFVPTTDSIQYHDSVTLGPNSMVKVDISCVYPTNLNKQLTDSMLTWISQQLSDSALKYKNNIPQLVPAKGREFLTRDTREAKNLYEERENTDQTVNYEFEEHISIAYQDSDYITLTDETYVYMNGAHGSTTITNTTFSLADGSQQGWNLLKGMDSFLLMQKITEGIKQYLGLSDDDNLYDHLLVDAIQMPVTPPFLMNDGIHLLYQQYEIAPYAVGMPEVVIPKLDYSHSAQVVILQKDCKVYDCLLKKGEAYPLESETTDTYEIGFGQDIAEIPISAGKITVWSAQQGHGFITAKFIEDEISRCPIHKEANQESKIISTLVYRSGEMPDNQAECLGLTDGWYKVSYDGMIGYALEAKADWSISDCEAAGAIR